jgi:hypothetical protein
MSFRGSILALSMATLFTAPAVADPVSTRASATERVDEAIAFRRLQSELMVAALACRDARHKAHYNTFVTHFRPMLADNARVLKSHFRRLHGPMAQKRLDSLITGLANEASLDSMGNPRFCINALERFEAVNNAGHNQTAAVILEEAELAVER